MNYQCPKCGVSVDRASPECPSCGLVFSKYKSTAAVNPGNTDQHVENVPSHSNTARPEPVAPRPEVMIGGFSAGFLLVLSILAVLIGVVILIVAQSAIHEIEAFMLFLISAVLLVGYAMLNAARAIIVAIYGVPPTDK